MVFHWAWPPISKGEFKLHVNYHSKRKLLSWFYHQICFLWHNLLYPEALHFQMAIPHTIHRKNVWRLVLQLSSEKLLHVFYRHLKKSGVATKYWRKSNLCNLHIKQCWNTTRLIRAQSCINVVLSPSRQWMKHEILTFSRATRTQDVHDFFTSLFSFK